MSTFQAASDSSKALSALIASAQASGDRKLIDAATAAEAACDALNLERLSLASRLAAASAQNARDVRKTVTLARVARTVHSSLELDVVLQRALDAATDLLGAQRGFIMLADESSGVLKLAAVRGLDITALETEELHAAKTTAAHAFASGETLVTTNAQNNPHPDQSTSVGLLELRSVICVPLTGQDDRRTGVAYFDSPVTPGLFTPQDPQTIDAFAGPVALAIDNARSFEDQRAKLREVMWLDEVQAKVLASITNGIVTIEAGGTITSFDEAAAETFGVPAQAMTGQPASALEALAPGLTRLIGEAEVGGKPFELHAIHPTRGTLTLQVRVAPLDLGARGHPSKPGVVIAITDFTERRALETMHRSDVEQRRAIGDAFSRYLAPHVVDLLMTAPTAFQMGGERRTATILFADIRDFTKMAARMPAERVVEILNSYFEAAVSVLFENDGLLDKFYGDGLMAVFGPPRVRADDAARALRSAARLHEVVRQLEPVIGEPLRISVGLATGEVVAGHIGSTRRLDYTVIGDAVNLASRLQSAAPPAATYCDETTYVQSGLELPGEKLQAKIKGRDELVTVYRLK